VAPGGPAAPELRLEREAKVAELLEGSGEPGTGAPEDRDGAAGGRLEASGVLAKDGCFYVIFDNSPHIARLGPALAAGAPENLLHRQERRDADGFEDIAYDPSSDRFFTLVEALEFRPGSFKAKVQQYDGRLRYLRSGWLDFPLDRPNKGLEGLTCLRRDGRSWLLGLCEGNRCRAGTAGRRPGGGRIQVFAEAGAGGGWEHAGTIRLPETLEFEDYSSLSVAGDRLAVVSQASSALWVGRLAPSGFEVAGEEGTFRFPRDPHGRTVYCTVEGVSWVAADRVVVVSDKAKRGTQGKRCRAKDQSIHIFTIPSEEGGRRP
jgi:hypothetical protein